MKRLVALVFPIAAVLLMIWLVEENSSAKHGVTRLLGFGEQSPVPVHPAVEEASVYIKPNTSGYDGQFYVQLALDPMLNDPYLEEVVDAPYYRARRIGMPVVAWVMGAGRPAWIFDAFAAINLFAWVMLAGWLWRRLDGLPDWETRTRWAACLFAVGTLDSVRLALTDLPSALLVLLACATFERGKDLRGAFACVFGILVKETSVLALASRVPSSFSLRAWGRYALLGVACVLPFGLWLLYVGNRFEADAGVSGNFAYPFEAMFAFVQDVFAQIRAGEASVHDYFGLAAVLSGLIQVVLCLRYALNDAWFRTAGLYALIFVLAGEKVWASTMAPLRIVLPMTFIVALRLPRGRFFFPLMLLIMLPGIHGLIRWIYNL